MSDFEQGVEAMRRAFLDHLRLLAEARDTNAAILARRGSGPMIEAGMAAQRADAALLRLLADELERFPKPETRNP